MFKNYRIIMWFSYLLVGLFYFYESQLRVVGGIVLPFMKEKLSGSDLHALTYISSYYLYVYTFLQLLFGFFLDRFGLRGILTFVAMMCGIGGIIFAFSNDTVMLEMSRFLIGLASAFVFVGFMYICFEFFPKKDAAFFIGLGSSLGMIGSFVGEGPSALILKEIGLQAAFLIFAGCAFLLALFLYLVLQSPRVHIDAGQTVIAPPSRFLRGLWQVAKRGKSWLIALSAVCYFAPVFVLTGSWGVFFIQSQNEATSEMALLATSMVFLGFAVGAPLIGLFSDRINNRKDPLTLFIFLSFVVVSTLIFFSPLPLAYVFVLLFLIGLCSSGQLLAYPYIVESHFFVLKGIGLSFVNALVFLGCALIGTLSNHITDKFLPFLPLFLVVSFVLVWVTREGPKTLRMPKAVQRNIASRARVVAKSRKVK